ncbi:unnamed protein product [Mycena citricolor]|uniref:Uncharacterized protein n=1 Tax=Mycena citricolor TaxID=2018698 RepID=A0AAD2HQU3_9AGAR|nr:unnamed protein product [Mycena citricolor]
MPNQYKPVPNAEDLRPFIEKYWKQNKKDVEIVELLKKYHIDLNKYGLEVQTFRKIREKLGSYARGVKATPWTQLGYVSSETVMRYFHTHEPDLVRERRRGHFKRKQFWAAGANDIWAVDQHDKWKYKFDLVEQQQSPPYIQLLSGNRGTAWAPLDAKEEDIMPEITWSQMRRRFTPGFEDILDVGVNEGWYNPGVLLEALVFRWVFIPWLQGELELYRHRVNNTAKRCDRNKILPHGVPTSMFEFPEDYAILDFKIKVDPIGIEKSDRSPELLKELDQLNDIDQSADARWGHVLTQPVDENIPLLPNLQELRALPDDAHALYAWFSDEEDSQDFNDHW